MATQLNVKLFIRFLLSLHSCHPFTVRDLIFHRFSFFSFFTEFNDLYIVGKFGFMTISTFTKIREPIANSTIVQLHVSDDDEIYLVTECGLVYKSNDFRNIMDLRFDELKFPGNDEKVARIAPGSNFVSIMTESGRCFSLLKQEIGRAHV